HYETAIASFACYACSGLTGSLTIPNSVTSIGDYAFWDCSGFTGSLTIPNSVTSIGVGAFQYCNGFTGSLTIPNSVTTIESDAFSHCSGFTGSLTIPNSVTTTGNHAFYGCSGFTELIIGKNVKSIEEFAWGSCTGLEIVECLAEEPYITDGWLFGNVDDPSLIQYKKATLVVPKGSIEKYKEVTPWKYFKTITDEKPIPVEAIALNNIEISEGESMRLEAVFTPENATNKYIGWASSDEAVATVDANGLVKAIKPGTATITATTSNNLTATCEVTVVAKPSGIEGVDGDDAPGVRVEGGEIVVDGKAEVFSITGSRVAVSDGGRISGLPHGIYIVRSNGKTVKLRL
ncbi:MAG: leucine-rich repeat protein, partial [Paramuribaculum sp.]|nr:leucine-rich repeat protein [Paramuribaculum sp.]